MRQQKSRKGRIIQELDAQLAANEFIRKNISQGRYSLFRAVADRLLHNQNQYQKLFKLCIEYFQKCMTEKTLPKKLQHFLETPSLFEDYKNYPDMGCFSKVHLQLISQYYQTRIEVYYLTDDMYLNSTIIDNNYRRTIHLSRILHHYDPVYTKQHLDLYNTIKDFIYEKLKLSEEGINSHEDDYVMERRPSQIVKRKHKKSLSACDETEYKELEFSLLNNCLQPSNKIEEQLNGVGGLVQQNTFEFDFPKQPSTLERKGSLDKFQFFNKNDDFSGYDYSAMGYNHHGYMPDYRLIQSQRYISYPQQQPLNNGNASRRYQGRLKFFDENKNYGFIIMDQDNSEIFVHFDDLSKAGITKEYLRNTKHGYILRFEFGCMFYLGKYKNSRKAVDLVMIQGYVTSMF